MATEGHNLKGLEDRLNSNDALRDEFLKNPAAILKREGVEVSDDQMKSIHDQVHEMNLAGIPKLPAAKPKIGIRITITIRF